jgi:hypothetical protein
MVEQEVIPHQVQVLKQVLEEAVQELLVKMLHHFVKLVMVEMVYQVQLQDLQSQEQAEVEEDFIIQLQLDVQVMVVQAEVL